MSKHRERRWPEPLELLARIQRCEPGKLASWLRAQRPLPEPLPQRAVFVSVTDLRRDR